MAKLGTDIEIQLDQPRPNLIKYIRLSKHSEIYCDSWRTKTYLCMDCKAVVASKVDHTRWHQKMIDLIIAIAYRSMTLDEAKAIQFQPSEINPLTRPDFG